MPRCEDEPIHLLGAVQPHGALVVVAPSSQAGARLPTIAQVSDNLADLLPLAPAEALGRPLAVLWRGEAPPALVAALDKLAAEQTVFLPAACPSAAADQRLDIFLSRRGDQILLEFERAVAAPASLLTDLHRGSARLSESRDASELCQRLAQEVRATFGYDRVLVYRFDAQFNGKVVAESRTANVASYLGHQFPESDIPSQARNVFRLNMQRMIADVRAKPARMHTASSTDQPADMTLCQLRAPSPIHLEYLQNLHVAASLTLSLRHDGSLWGLVACHHETPRYLSPAERNAAELLAMLANALLDQKVQQDNAELAAELGAVNERLGRQMQQCDNTLAALCDADTTLLGLSAAEGVSVAICLDGRWRVLGKAPPLAFCSEVIGWLEGTHKGRDVVSTSHLQEGLPSAAAHAAVASGLLAISLPHGDRSFILWFRPELLREVSWAGNPQENKRGTSDGRGYLHPRQSFARFKEIVRGHSQAIVKEEVAAAVVLRKALIEADLAHKAARETRLRQTAEAERQRAEHAMALREHVLGVVSHDLRNPLNAIMLSADLMRRKLAQGPQPALFAAQQRFVEKIDAATLRMHRLIEDVLSLSAFQGGKLQVERVPLSGRALLEKTCALLEPLAQSREQQLTVVGDQADVVVRGDHERLLQALGNLVSNAVKFTPVGGAITLRIKHAPEQQEALFCVADTGRGIAPADQARIFETYYQAAGREAKLGAGLGLSIVKQIVEAHGGRVWVDSVPGEGAEMWFSCPLAAPDVKPRPFD